MTAGASDLILTTSRLHLRRLRSDDLDWLCRLHGDPDVMRYVREPQSRKQTTARLGELLADVERDPRFGIWPAETQEAGQVVGWFLLHPFDGGAEFELGYRLFPEFWGQGLATEGAQGVVAHAFETLGLDALMALARLDNVASHRVLEKSGFTRRENRVAYGSELVYFHRLP